MTRVLRFITAFMAGWLCIAALGPASPASAVPATSMHYEECGHRHAITDTAIERIPPTSPFELAIAHDHFDSELSKVSGRRGGSWNRGDSPHTRPALTHEIARATATTGAQVGGEGSSRAQRALHVAANGADEGVEGGLNLFKWNHPTSTRSTGWRDGDYMLHLPNQGTPKATWAQNSSRLRPVMRSGKPIFESYVDSKGNLIPTTGFLNAERNVPINRGWTYAPGAQAWFAA